MGWKEIELVQIEPGKCMDLFFIYEVGKSLVHLALELT